jgi:hypothetical protein
MQVLNEKLRLPASKVLNFKIHKKSPEQIVHPSRAGCFTEGLVRLLRLHYDEDGSTALTDGEQHRFSLCLTHKALELLRIVHRFTVY